MTHHVGGPSIQSIWGNGTGPHKEHKPVASSMRPALADEITTLTIVSELDVWRALVLANAARWTAQIQTKPPVYNG